MKNYIILSTFISVIFFSCSDSSKAISGNLDPKQFSAVADSLINEQLVDVRTPGEFAEGHINGAMNMDWNGTDFSTAAGNLDKTRPVMVYCLSGGRSSEAADWFKKNGFPDVYQLNHGILGWKADNLPLVQGEKKAEFEEVSGVVSVEMFNTMLTSKPIVLVDFGATWCGPCKMLAPRLTELEKEMGDKFRLVKLDADRDAELANSMNITALPTLLLYKNGKLLWRNEGLIDKSVIAEQILIAEK